MAPNRKELTGGCFDVTATRIRGATVALTSGILVAAAFGAATTSFLQSTVGWGVAMTGLAVGAGEGAGTGAGVETTQPGSNSNGKT